MVHFVDKTRTGIPGHPKLKGVQNASAWGESAAVQRGYCKGTEVHDEPAKGPAPYGAEFKVDQREDRQSFNDVKDGWLRGGGANQAEGKPGYAPSFRAPRGSPSGTRPKIRPGDTGPHAKGRD
jgi:hypothetical protein